MNQFVSEKMKKTYSIKGYNIELQLEPEVFCPSEHGTRVGEYIAIKKGDTVLDMGTGTGILGIIAAKKGGVVDVSDNSKQAVNLAMKNAKLNDVKLEGYIGEYFCTEKPKYDYIIANLPQEIIPTNYAKQIGYLEKTISGGPKGNKHLLTFLKQAHNHMHDDSRALIAVYSVSDYIATLQNIKKLYSPKLLEVITSPAKDFVQDNISWYLPMIQKGEVGLFQRDGVWQSTIMIYELRKKKEK
jgi:release factor glutamine methyltransferase